MRIAHVITRLILGGAQENTLFACEDLLRIYGDEVLLVTGPALGPEGSLLERGRAGGLPLEIVPSLRRAIHPWRDLVAYRRIKAALARFRPQVVHTHSAKAGILGRAAASALGVPAIVHGVHGAPFHPYQGRGARLACRACERWAAKRCHAFVSVADAMTELMVRSGVAPRERFTTIYSGMEVEPLLDSARHRLPTRQSLGYRPEQIVVGKVARLFPLKGHEDLVQAARRIVQVVPQVRFLLVGDGLLAGRLRDQIAACGLEDHFQLTGLVPPEQIPVLLSAMDLVVHASLREGLARALPQALIAGKPVVSYDVDGAREVVIPDQTGYLVPPRDVEGLVRSILELAADPALRQRLGDEGRRRFTDLFRHQRTTAQLRTLYERLLSATPHEDDTNEGEREGR
jgi:glycosyltransferase involved in cell wall biosynthesis